MIQSAQKVRADLTDRQAEVLAFILSCIEQRGWSPTVRDIGAHFGIRSPNGVMCHLRALQKKGYIDTEYGRARARRPTLVAHLTQPTPHYRELSILATVAWLSATRGQMPKVADLIEATGLHPEAVALHLDRLQDLGCIRWDAESEMVCVVNPTAVRE